MNKVQVIIIAALAAAAGFLGAWFLAGQTGGESGQTGEAEREILYWVAPMDPNYRRDEPGKSPMGMDLVPVYADEAGQAAERGPSIRINPAVINNIGVKTAPVERRDMNRQIDAVGVVTADGGRISHVHVRTEGWIEELHIKTQGDRVSAGDPLFEIYSPALVSAQEEYLQASRTGNQSLLRAARIRLVALGMSDDQVEALGQRGSSTRRFTVQAPRDGYVIELNVRQGMYVQPGNTIISVADLTRVWVEVDLFEGQIAWVDTGQAAAMTLPFSATDREWDGEVDYVYPTMRAETRTGRVRLAFDNPDLALKPNMYASVEIAASPHRHALAVPTQSIIRTGDGKRVMLALGDGRFRPARVETGLEVDGMTEIVAGLDEGEQIVVSGQFLIDSEASVDASLLRMIGERHDHGDMGHDDMDHDAMDHETMDHETMEDMDHGAMDHEAMEHVDHGAMDHTDHADTASEDRNAGGQQ
ncbi:MAG TPA: efflux RND transporter periplasmic adaptor subunit [Wenzhouxiangella sp.]|nr:efflux RND transporter periplasmic adaptor subunit [Wenzhouxiangella sp.]